MPDSQCVLVLDAGTTSTRAILYAADGRKLASEARDITQY